MAEEGTVVVEDGNVTVNGAPAVSGSVVPAPPADTAAENFFAIISNTDGHERISHGFETEDAAKAWADQNRPGHTDVRTYPSVQQALEAYDGLSKES